MRLNLAPTVGRRPKLTVAGAALGLLVAGLAVSAGHAQESGSGTPAAPQAPTAADSPIGWASTNGGTTGGDSGNEVVVDSADELVAAISSSESSVVRVQGSISLSGMNDVASDKTIIGDGSGASITGGGLDLNGVSNVVIRNLSFNDWDDDAINVQESSTNVWIDHNTFGSGHDGAVDIKRESDFITVSWNHLDGSGKSMLLGHSDDHTADVGHLRVTYHHNWFDGSGTRHPRVRFGNPVHVFNNYYNGNEYGVASTQDAGVLVEGNYFEAVDEPTLVGYADSDEGNLVERDNEYVDSGTPQSKGSVADIPYSYTLESASAARDSVQAGAGAGKI